MISFLQLELARIPVPWRVVKLSHVDPSHETTGHVFFVRYDPHTAEPTGTLLHPDKAPEPRAVGAGIGIQPIGMTALRRLGLLDTVKQHGARITGIKTATAAGRPVLDVAYERYDRRLFGLGLHRGVLFKALLAATEAEGPERIRTTFDVSVEAVEQGADEAFVVTSRAAAAAVGDSGGKQTERHGPYDLVVLADGANSALRKSLKVRAAAAPKAKYAQQQHEPPTIVPVVLRRKAVVHCSPPPTPRPHHVQHLQFICELLS